MGDFGQPALRPEQQAAIGEVDVLFLPVGDGPTIGGQRAADVVRALRPRLVVPMHYRTEAVTSSTRPTPSSRRSARTSSGWTASEADVEDLLGTREAPTVALFAVADLSLAPSYSSAWPTRPRILVTGATGKVGQALLRPAAAPRDGIVRGGHGARRCATTACSSPARGSRSCAARSSEREVVERGDRRRHPRRASGDEQGDAGHDHGRRGQGPLLAARGVPRRARPSGSSSSSAATPAVGHFVYPHPVPVTETAAPHAPTRAATRCRRCSRRRWSSSTASSTT